jgi:hypothetical protein
MSSYQLTPSKQRQTTRSKLKYQSNYSRKLKTDNQYKVRSRPDFAFQSQPMPQKLMIEQLLDLIAECISPAMTEAELNAKREKFEQKCNKQSRPLPTNSVNQQQLKPTEPLAVFKQLTQPRINMVPHKPKPKQANNKRYQPSPGRTPVPML